MSNSDDATKTINNPHYAEDLLDLIGNTPLLRLRHFRPKDGADIFAKLEFMNPGGSVKDRTALGMVLQAEAEGRLSPGATLVEPTSGNTGVGLAIVALLRGYRVIIVMSDKFVGQKTQLLQVMGAELALTPAAEGMEGAFAKAREIVKSTPGATMLGQFEYDANPNVHHDTTATEVHRQLNRLPNAIVLTGGTGGTFTGMARYFKAQGDVHAVLVEPVGSIWGGGPPGPREIEGIGQSFWPEVLDRTYIDEVISVTGEEALGAAKEIVRTQGLLVGGSAGAAAHAARLVAERMGPEDAVVTLFPDSVERYLGRGLFAEF